MNAAPAACIGHERSQEDPVFFLENPCRSFAGCDRECVPYRRGEGLVDSPRHPETGVFPPILPHRSAACSRRLHGVHRGYIGISMLAVVPHIGGGCCGA